MVFPVSQGVALGCYWDAPLALDWKRCIAERGEDAGFVSPKGAN